MKTITIEISDEQDAALNDLAQKNNPETETTGEDYLKARIEDLLIGYVDSRNKELNETYFKRAMSLPYEERVQIMSLIDAKAASTPGT